MKLLGLYTKCNFIKLKSKIYHQDEGMAMGSPLSPLFANICIVQIQAWNLVEALRMIPFLYLNDDWLSLCD